MILAENGISLPFISPKKFIPLRKETYGAQIPSPPHGAEEEDLELSQELDQVLAYHQATKHSFTKMAPGPRAMDWSNGPLPFPQLRSPPFSFLPMQPLATPSPTRS